MNQDTVKQIDAEKFVSVTTFKRDGSAVAAPMWIVRDGPDLLAWTPADSWKVKRLRRDPRVRLSPCGRSGKVEAGAPVWEAEAVVVTDPAQVSDAASRIKNKYGIEFRIITVIEAIVARGRKPRVALRIS